MSELQKKSITNKFPLRLMPSVRRAAEDFSQREGVSLNQFINLAVAEKLAHLQHEQWLSRRPQPTPALLARGLELLDHPHPRKPEPDDQIPASYRSRSARNSKAAVPARSR